MQKAKLIYNKNVTLSTSCLNLTAMPGRILTNHITITNFFFRRHLKKVFSSDIGVEPSYHVLDILEYDCRLILGLVLISTENPNFEIASRKLQRFQWSPDITLYRRIFQLFCWSEAKNFLISYWLYWFLNSYTMLFHLLFLLT